MVSKQPKTPSTGEPDEQSTDSVYDFLYHDAARVASFLSQFDNSGSLTQVIQGAGISKSKQDTATASVEAGIPLVAKGAGTYVKAASDEHRKDSQRVYDPVWANARTFLDFLSERELLKRDLLAASIGQFVLCSGSLSISDLQLMHKTWQLPSVKKAMRAGMTPSGNRHDRLKAAATSTASNNDGLELFWDMVTILPHTIQARLSGDVEVWCSLSQSGLSGDASDITLKHGTTIPGAWSIVGILDAKPDAADVMPTEAADFSNGAAEMAVKMMGIIAPIARNLLGRPQHSFGVTPLLVFREITA